MLPVSKVNFHKERRAHWDGVALESQGYQRWSGYYHRWLEKVFRFIVPPAQRILEIGCADGNLLASLTPSFGVGVDFSFRMIENARRHHPQHQFIQADGSQLPLRGSFDFILLSDLLNDVWDVQDLLQEVHRLSHARTRIIINCYNRVWEPALSLADKLNLARPNLYQNWLTVEDVENLLNLADFELIKRWEEFLWPVQTPIVAGLVNRVLARLWPFNHLALTHLMVARPTSVPVRKDKPTVSVIIPARNEAGNIPEIFRRFPDLRYPTELIFVEGHSKDDTYQAIQRAIESQPDMACKIIQQKGEGKGDAVREGFALASGDLLIILDADMTVPPEELPRFLEVLISGKAEFANGVRLVYPMQDEAMRFINLVGNKLFSLTFSWLLGQRLKDTLCGTKALWKEDYDLIAKERNYFGRIDPFGDFDLLLGAAKQNLKIVDVPIRYHSRTYGSTNISRWSHGWLLLRMMVSAARRIKFV